MTSWDTYIFFFFFFMCVQLCVSTVTSAKLFIIYFICVNVLSACMKIHHMHVLSPWWLEEASDILKLNLQKVVMSYSVYAKT